MSDHCDAFLGTLVEPLEEGDGALGDMVAGLPDRRVVDVFVGLDLAEVEVRELLHQLSNGSSPVTGIRNTLSTLLAHEKLWTGQLGVLEPLGENGRDTGFTWRSEDVVCALQSSGEGGDDHEVEVSELPSL